MSEKEILFEKYFNALSETLEQTVKFHSISKFCRKSDYLNNTLLTNCSEFIDNLYICSNHARIACLNKLIDKTGFSFYSLITFIRTYPQIFEAKKDETFSKLDEIESDLKQHDKVIKYLIEHRNEFHAHLGKRSVKSEDIYNIFFEFKVSEEEIDSLIKSLCQNMINSYFIFHELYGNVYFDNLLKNEDFLYEVIEIKKVFSLMYSSSVSKASTDIYFNNLTKHY
jgi:hypothetical protein